MVHKALSLRWTHDLADQAKMNLSVWQNFPTVVLLVDSTDRESVSKLADLVEARHHDSRLLVLLTKQDRVSENPWLDENPGLCPAEVAARLGLLNVPTVGVAEEQVNCDFQICSPTQSKS